MRRAATPAVLAALAMAGCGKAPDFETFKDTSGKVALEVPAGWGRRGDDGLGRTPMAAVTFVGDLKKDDEGLPLGAVISVTRFSRSRSDYPAEKKERAYWEANVLVPTEVLFGEAKPSKLSKEARATMARDVRDTTLAGLPAKTYRRDFVHRAGGRPLHGQARDYPMRLEDVVVRTPESYYVLEFRATRDLFDKHYPAFERAKRSFKLLESGKG